MIPWLRNRHPDEATLSAFVDNALSPKQYVRVAAQIEACEECRAAVAELRSLKSMLAAMPTVDAPRSFVIAAPAAARERQTVLRPIVSRYALAPAALAMVALIILVGVDLATLPGSQPVTERTASSAPATKAQAGAPDSVGGGAGTIAATPFSAQLTPPAATPPAPLPRAATTDNSAGAAAAQAPTAEAAPVPAPAETGASAAGGSPAAPAPAITAAAAGGTPAAQAAPAITAAAAAGSPAAPAPTVTAATGSGSPPAPAEASAAAATGAPGAQEGSGSPVANAALVTPIAPTPVPIADSARPTIVPAPRLAPDEGPSAPATSATSGRTPLHVAEGGAALVLLLSLAYIFWRTRRSVV